MEEFRTMGSMADKLLNFISSSSDHDANYDIALHIVKNYASVRKLNQKQIAQLCYVSEATISRFCRFLGFQDFHDFHHQMERDFSLSDDYSRRLLNLMKGSSQQAAEYYRNELVQAMNETVSEALFADAAKAAEHIHDAGHVSIFSHHFLWDIGRYMQQKLMMAGKYVSAYQTYEKQMEEAGRLDHDSLAVICTAGGSWFSRYQSIYDRILNSGAHQLVMTQNLSSPYLNRADLVMQCGISNVDNIGRYCMLAGADAIILQYLKKYGDK